MKYTENYEENHVNLVLVYMVVIMAAVIVGVTAIIFILNKPESSSKGFQRALAQSQQSSQYAKNKMKTDEMVKSVDELVTGSTLTSDQLDIWTLPNTQKSGQETKIDTKNGTVKNQTTGETLVQGVTSTEKSQPEVDAMTETTGLASEQEESLEEDGQKQMTLVLADGTEQMIDIQETLAKHTYDVAQLTYQKPEMKYYEKKEQVSSFGVDVSAQDGTVDFTKLKRAGCDFVMVRVGQRGSSSGRIVMDSMYKTNLANAKKAGLDLGVYFYSQAVSKEEVLEEADSLLSAIDNYTLTYPVMFDMEAIADDSARTDGLDIDTRTYLAKVFMDEIIDAGHDVILYGNLEWLLTKLHLEELTEYDICVAENGEKPSYPYDFKMWQYQDSATINGMTEKTRLFVWMKNAL